MEQEVFFALLLNMFARSVIMLTLKLKILTMKTFGIKGTSKAAKCKNICTVSQESSMTRQTI